MNWLRAKLIGVGALVLALAGALLRLFFVERKFALTEEKRAKAEAKQLKDYTEAMKEAEREGNELVQNAESRGDDDRRDVDL